MNKVHIATHKVRHDSYYHSLSHMGAMAYVSGVYRCRNCGFEHHHSPTSEDYCVKHFYLEPPVLPDRMIASMGQLEKLIADHRRVSTSYLKRHGTKFNIPSAYIAGYTSQHYQSYNAMLHIGLIEEYQYQNSEDKYDFYKAVRLVGMKSIQNPKVVVLDMRPNPEPTPDMTVEELNYARYNNYKFDSKTLLWNKPFESETFTTDQIRTKYLMTISSI